MPQISGDQKLSARRLSALQKPIIVFVGSRRYRLGRNHKQSGSLNARQDRFRAFPERPKLFPQQHILVLRQYFRRHARLELARARHLDHLRLQPLRLQARRE